MVVDMWPALPKGMKPSPQVYKSPVGEERFERVAKIQRATVNLVKRTSSYTAVISIPWREPGMEPPGEASLRGDLGVLFSDDSGARTVRRRYLFNLNTNIVDDIPSEVRLRPQDWGEVRFE